MATAKPQPGGDHLPLITLIALCGMAPLSGLAVSGIAPIMPMITAEFADNPNAGILVRLMMSGLSAATILGALASGVMASRIGQLRLLLLLLVLYVVSGAGIFLLDNLYLMIFARCLQGIANGGAGVLAIALITTRVPSGRSDHWLGYYSVCGTIGVLFLMVAVGEIAALGWRYVFLMFLLAVPVGLMIGLTLQKDRKPVVSETAEEQQKAPRSPIPWAIALFATLCGAIVTTIAMYLPYHLADIGYGSPDTVAMLMVAGAGVAAVPALAFGWIRARFSAIQTFVFAFAVIAAGVIIVVFARDLPLIFFGMALHGLGMGAMMPNLFSACAGATTPELRTRMLGFVRAGIYAGPLLAQPGLEAVMATSGATAVLAAIGVASVLAGILSFTGRHMFDPVEEASTA
ncbi:MAG: MFS transporter [Novosphingobium sp.]|nr:MFS transporter [Novosphingobium sp.]